MSRTTQYILRAYQAARKARSQNSIVYSTDPEVKLELDDRRDRYERRRSSEIQRLFWTESSRGRGWHNYLGRD